MKATILHNNEHTNIIISDPDITPAQCKLKITSNTFTLPLFHTTSDPEKINKVTKTIPHDIHLLNTNRHNIKPALSKQTLSRHNRTKPAQLRVNKSPLTHSKS